MDPLEVYEEIVGTFKCDGCACNDCPGELVELCLGSCYMGPPRCYTCICDTKDNYLDTGILKIQFGGVDMIYSFSGQLSDEMKELDEAVAEMVNADDFRDVHIYYDKCQTKLSLLYQECLKVLLGGTTV